MKLISETKVVTIEVTEKEYIFILWCLDNADRIDIVENKTKLDLTEISTKFKSVSIDSDEIPF